MNADGLSDQAIDKLISQHKLWVDQKKITPLTNTARTDQSSVVNTSCSDLGGENGWSLWQAKQGNFDDPIGTYSTMTWGAVGAPTSPRFNLKSGLSIDPCTPGPAIGAPVIPVVCPGFGNVSLQLGQPQTDGNLGGCLYGCAEQISIPFTVSATDTNFIYAYAIVLENPSNHQIFEAPFAEIYMLGPLGDTIPCSHHKYMGDILGGIPAGMYQAACLSLDGGANDVAYKPWTTVGVNLRAYIGQTLNIVVTNSDCALGGHFCHSYWDFACGSIPLSSCTGNQSSICGPTDPLIPYTYQWYKNGSAMSAPAGTQQCLSIIPNSGDTFLVNVIQPSGCNFYMNYVANGLPLQALFTYALNTNTITCTNLSSSANSYVWSFGDGNSSTQANPVYTFTSTGTYSVCLVASSSGCSDTVCKVINITATALQEQEMSSTISVYPSPADENLFIDFGNNNLGKAKVTFTDLPGRILYKTNIASTEKQSLNVSGISKGIYLITLKTDYGIVTKKIIISH